MTTTTSTSATNNEARENWARYLYGRDRGHLEYMEQAARNEGMYLGGGEQWNPDDRAVLEDEGRPAYEFNEVMPSVNSALGYQIHNRMDITFKPRGERGDPQTATILSKVVMQVADQARLHWHETQACGDGLIEQRGYFDVRMDFDSNIKGDLRIELADPRDVIPDPDAKTYDPDGWADVIVTRWLTLDEIEQRYGKPARLKAEASGDDGPDWGEQDEEVMRNRFGNVRTGWGYYDAYSTGDGKSLRRYRIIDRQKWVFENTDCLVYPDTGDVVAIADMTAEQVEVAKGKGAMAAKRMRKRIKWAVSTYSATLFSEYSKMQHFSLVPYFPYFRRGKTRGLVDNAIGPQEALNKAVSQFVAIVNTAANSGWIVEQDSLTNMSTEDLEDDGAKTGLVLEYKQGTQKPTKIEPNPVPTGIDRLIDLARTALKEVTVPDAMRGIQGQEVSGVAIQSKQFASQQQLAVPLDNLAYTRALLATRLYKLIQRYYDSYRIFRITEIDQYGNKVDKVLEINKPMPDGSYYNDITAGEYDLVVSEQPMQITFENSQFTQVLEMRKEGVAIPDPLVVRYSNLADKQEIIEGMQQAQAAAQPPADPEAEAKAVLSQAQADTERAKTEKVQAETVEIRGRTMYSAMQSAQVIAAVPQTAGLADELLASQGFVDQNAAPLVPELAQAAVATENADGLVPNNTDPLTPSSPERGVAHGIETPQNDGAQRLATMPA